MVVRGLYKCLKRSTVLSSTFGTSTTGADFVGPPLTGKFRTSEPFLGWVFPPFADSLFCPDAAAAGVGFSAVALLCTAAALRAAFSSFAFFFSSAADNFPPSGVGFAFSFAFPDFVLGDFPCAEEGVGSVLPVLDLTAFAGLVAAGESSADIAVLDIKNGALKLMNQRLGLRPTRRRLRCYYLIFSCVLICRDDIS